jgi:hypothetical protein
MLKSNPYATLADIAAAQRLAKAAAVRPFVATIGGSFRPRAFDPGSPSTRALDAAAERIARDERDAAAIRDGFNRYRTRCGTYR